MSIILRLSVYDQPGVLDRITGIIRRNGWNISGINAGEVDQGISKINLLLKDRGANVASLGKHLSSLDCVQSWEECSTDTHFIRELLILKLREQDFSQELLAGARIMERHGDMLYMEYSGLPWEIDELQQKLHGRIIDCTRAGVLSIIKEGGEANA